MEGILVAFPAYGRRYKSTDAMRKDFLDGKDFSCSYSGGPYFSVRDFTDNDVCKVFDGVVLTQPGKTGTHLAIGVTRRAMCEAKAAGVTKQYTSDGRKA